MKKVLSILLCAAMLTVFAGCTLHRGGTGGHRGALCHD